MADIKVKGLTLKKMMHESLIIDLNNSKNVHVLGTKFTLSAKGRKAVIGTCQSVQTKASHKPEKYKCSIIGLEDEGPLSAQKCMVSCPCERFTYYYEVALTKKGASKVKYSNGDMPVVTNPNMLTGMCKHLIALSKELTKKKL
jgi:hypothetical protein